MDKIADFSKEDLSSDKIIDFSKEDLSADKIFKMNSNIVNVIKSYYFVVFRHLDTNYNTSSKAYHNGYEYKYAKGELKVSNGFSLKKHDVDLVRSSIIGVFNDSLYILSETNLLKYKINLDGSLERVYDRYLRYIEYNSFAVDKDENLYVVCKYYGKNICFRNFVRKVLKNEEIIVPYYDIVGTKLIKTNKNVCEMFDINTGKTDFISFKYKFEVRYPNIVRKDYIYYKI